MLNSNYQKKYLKDIPDYFYIKIDNSDRKLLFKKAIRNSGGRQVDLAKHLKIDRRRLEKWKMGIRCIPLGYLKEICSIARLDLSFLEQKEIWIKGGRYAKTFLIFRFPLEINKKWAWMSQIINTDGHIDPKRKAIEISNTDWGVINKIKEFCIGLNLNKSVYERKHNDNAVFISICNKTLTNLFIEFLGCEYGSKFSRVKISDNLLNSSNKSVIASAFRGAFDGDGWVCMRLKRIGLTMGSEVYVKQVSKALYEKFGIKNKLYGPRDKKFNCEISSLRYLERFQTEINFDNKKRKDRLTEIINSLRSSYQKKFHPGCSRYECLKVVRENPGCTSGFIGIKLNRDRGSVRPILQILREKNWLSFSKKGKEFIYTVSNEGLKVMEEFK
ncbi:MAG: LAGLIDADG family homing endonuclease [Candidatus Woesearchaeota archaeon]